MGLSASKPLPRLPVPSGKTRICVAGFGLSHHTGRARRIADAIAQVYPETYETWYYFSTSGFRPDFLNSVKESLSNKSKFESHTSSPFCWTEQSDGTKTGIGGRDSLCDWVQENFDVNDEKNEPFVSLTKDVPTRTRKEVFFDSTTPGTAKTSEE